MVELKQLYVNKMAGGATNVNGTLQDQLPQKPVSQSDARCRDPHGACTYSR